MACRRDVASWYRDLLAGDERLFVPAEPDDCLLSWFVFVVRLADNFALQQRDAVLEAMTAQKIQVGNYFPPVHLQPFIAQAYGHHMGDFPLAEAAAQRTLALPFHTQLTQDDVAFVAGTLRGVLDTVSA